VEYILTAFPDLGPKAARDLLHAFGSLRGVLSASKKELTAVKGIGEKTAESVLSTPDIIWYD
ncbi:MAG TPA: helix-hairpin-helix domain-containing protein, partial [Methanocorpusculum sp.]|nr:helix-hairpin-helix domain-containing protein [Methanocorpusculum sp.]